MSGSTTSLDRLQIGTTIGLSLVSMYKPLLINSSRIAFLAWNLFIPYNHLFINNIFGKISPLVFPNQRQRRTVNFP